MALRLQLRTRIKLKPPIRSCPYLTHPFSTSNSGDGNPDPPNPKSPFASYFNDVKERLKEKQSTTSPLRKTTPFSFTNPQSKSNSNSRPSEVESLEEIRKNLSEFRRRASPPYDAGEPSSAPISFQEIYNRNVTQKPLETLRGTDKKNSWDAIRESMRQIRSNKPSGGPMTLPEFRNALNSKPSGYSDAGGSSVIGGTSELPTTIFGRELIGRKESLASPTEFVKMYGYEELGQKLRKLRPKGEGKEGFSLKELNERLGRLREMEEKESLSSTKGIIFNELRESLKNLQASSDEEKGKKSSSEF